MGLRTTFAVEPGNLDCQLHGKYYYHEIALWDDFKGLHFVVYVASRLGEALCLERAQSLTFTTARVIKTNPTTPVVELMVEKFPFAAPFCRRCYAALDTGSRAIS
jgi:hypothetical protein